MDTPSSLFPVTLQNSTGFHWAVYNQYQGFYGYDDDDITSGEAAAMPVLQEF